MSNVHLAAQYFLNHELKDQELISQTGMLADAGYECIYAHSRYGLKTPYISDEWFHAVKVIMDCCKAEGIKFAIWDEDGFPSPQAAHRVAALHPEYTSRRLEPDIFYDVKAGTPFFHVFNSRDIILYCFAVDKNGKITDITEKCGTVSCNFKPPRISHSAYTPIMKMGSPHWRRSAVKHQQAISFTPETDCTVVSVRLFMENGSHTVDLLNADAIRCFLDETHEAYFRHFKDEFGTTVVSSFMDEPSVGCDFPWTAGFPETYQKFFNEDIVPLLPHLFLDIDRRTPEIRHRYRMVQHHLLCTCFLDQVRSWCNAHRIESIGHLSRTEYLSGINGSRWPNELRCCKYLDIPCTDPLGFNIAWEDCAAYATGIKVVSSAANLFGKRSAGSDALAVMGNEAKLRDIRFQLDFQMVLGITYFNIHGLFYSLDGARKDEAPPSLFYQHSEWELMETLLKRTAGLCRKLSSSPPVSRNAVLYPSPAFYCVSADRKNQLEKSIHLLVEKLLSNHRDFEFIDETTIAEFSTPELDSRYDCIIIPEIDFITPEAAAAVGKFSGKVFFQKSDIRLVSGELWEMPQNSAGSGDAAFIEQLPGEEVCGENSKDIFCRRLQNGTVFLFNRSEKLFNGKFNGTAISVPPRSGELLTDAVPLPEVSTVCELTGPWHWQARFNHIPLTTACCPVPEKASNYFDLQQRQIPDAAQWSGHCSFQFTYQGAVDQLLLVMDQEDFEKLDLCKVNGNTVNGFRNETFHDCRNFAADITRFIRTGNNPTLNVIELYSDVVITEMPRLYGKFTAEFPHCSTAMPKLSCSSLDFYSELQDWRNAGFGAFSGKITLEKEFLWEGGELQIDLGRVEDAVIAAVDGEKKTVLYSPPYIFRAGTLNPGKHRLTLTVFNAPANRENLAGLAAGVLGPVTLQSVK